MPGDGVVYGNGRRGGGKDSGNGNGGGGGDEHMI